jgi:hypothetical protein
VEVVEVSSFPEFIGLLESDLTISPLSPGIENAFPDPISCIYTYPRPCYLIYTSQSDTTPFFTPVQTPSALHIQKNELRLERHDATSYPVL